MCFTLLPCQHLIPGGIQLSCFELASSFTRILYKINEGEEQHASYCLKFLYFLQSSFFLGKPMGAVSVFKIGNYHDEPHVFLL